MKGDFSRNTFDPKKNFRRVLMQQGRVLLDADWNEQSAILLHYIQTLAKDLIGPHAGPGEGFKLVPEINGATLKNLTITAGHYYVDGILCENPEDVSYFNQPYFRDERKEFPANVPFFVYLDVWERHVTSLEDESLAEVALGGIDTTTRSQVVWQVKLRELTPSEDPYDCGGFDIPEPPSVPGLSADVPSSESDGSPCNIAPDSRYRGAENQLYRVEIHTGNVKETGQLDGNIKPTFKWSRENGSVVFPIIGITSSGETTEVRLAHLGRDEKFGLREGDWVEVVDDDYALNNRVAKLLKVSVIDRDEMSVTLEGATGIRAEANSKNHALLRRWDQKPLKDGADLTLEDDNAAQIVEGEWLKLEDGIQIKFVKKEGSANMRAYRSGDYWLIPARTTTGDIVWVTDDNGEPLPLPPHRVEHHYAPLGIFQEGGFSHCRCSIQPIRDCPDAESERLHRESVATEEMSTPPAKKKTSATKDKKTPK